MLGLPLTIMKHANRISMFCSEIETLRPSGQHGLGQEMLEPCVFSCHGKHVWKREVDRESIPFLCSWLGAPMVPLGPITTGPQASCAHSLFPMMLVTGGSKKELPLKCPRHLAGSKTLGRGALLDERDLWEVRKLGRSLCQPG